MLAEPINEYPTFPLAVAEAYNLPAAVVLDLLDRRLALLEEQLQFLETGEAAVRQKDVERRYWIDLQYQQAMLRTEVGWIRGLQDQLRSGELPW
jgi:hypothetical protein